MRMHPVNEAAPVTWLTGGGRTRGHAPGVAQMTPGQTRPRAAWLVAAWILCAALPVCAQCRGTLYLTIDTGSMSQAELIAQTLNKHAVKATFFLANEKTVDHDMSLGDA